MSTFAAQPSVLRLKYMIRTINKMLKYCIYITLILINVVSLYSQDSNHVIKINEMLIQSELSNVGNINNLPISNTNESKQIALNHYIAGSMLFSSVYIALLLSGAIIIEKTGIKAPYFQPELFVASFCIGYPISFLIGGHLFLTLTEQNSYNTFATIVLTCIPSAILGGISAICFTDFDVTRKVTLISISMFATYFITMGMAYWTFGDSYKLQTRSVINNNSHIIANCAIGNTPNTINVFNEQYYTVEIIKIIF